MNRNIKKGLYKEAENIYNQNLEISKELKDFNYICETNKNSGNAKYMLGIILFI